jgi:hypothetical protein
MKVQENSAPVKGHPKSRQQVAESNSQAAAIAGRFGGQLLALAQELVLAAGIAPASANAGESGPKVRRQGQSFSPFIAYRFIALSPRHTDLTYCSAAELDASAIAACGWRFPAEPNASAGV